MKTPILSLIILLCAWSFLPQDSSAQHVPLTGIDGTRLRLAADSMTIFMVRGNDTIPTGMLWDELSRIEENGAALLQRVYRSQDRVLGMRTDTLIDHYTTLLPVRHRSRATRSQEFLEFSDQRVVGWMRLPNRDSVDIDVQVPLTVYNGSSFDLLLRSAPLAEGWSTEVPAFISAARSTLVLRARVVASEQIAGERCWQVDADFSGTPVSFWVQEQSRDLCQQVMRLSPEMQVLFRRGVSAPR